MYSIHSLVKRCCAPAGSRPGSVLGAGLCREQGGSGPACSKLGLALLGLLSCWHKDLSPCRSKPRNVL